MKSKIVVIREKKVEVIKDMLREGCKECDCVTDCPLRIFDCKNLLDEIELNDLRGEELLPNLSNFEIDLIYRAIMAYRLARFKKELM